MSSKPDIEALVRAARSFACNGIAVMPVSQKRPLREWKPLTKQLRTPDEVEDDIRRNAHRVTGIAAIGGRVSGGLLILDFDLPAFWARWSNAVEQRAANLPYQRTGGGGYQVLLRIKLECDACNGTGTSPADPPVACEQCEGTGIYMPGNEKLAWAKNDQEQQGREVAIETRGECGYALMPPSVHPDTGNLYRREGDIPLSQPPLIDRETYEFLRKCAEELDEAPTPLLRGDAPPTAPAPQQQQQQPRNGKARNATSVDMIEAFNQASDVGALLARHGYTLLSGGKFRRPGKDRGESGKIVTDPDGVQRAVHFSTNDPQNDGKFGNGLCGRHSAFDLFAQFEHGGDFKKATAAIREMGFGDNTGGGGGRAARSTKKQSEAPTATRDEGADQQGSHDAGDIGGDDDHGGGRRPKLGERDGDGILYLSQRRTLPTARAFVRDHYTHDDPQLRTLHFCNDSLWTWRRNRYQQVENVELRHQLYPYLHEAFTYYKDRHGEIITTEFPANHSTVESALAAIRDHVVIPPQRTIPFWIDDKRDPRYPQSVEPEHLIPCRSFNFHVNTGERLPPTPALFAMSSIDFDPEPDALEPTAWLGFLKALWPNDPDQIATLQEFMGYLLTSDTRQQKALMIVGPRRAGKGTIIRTIEKLVGETNVAGLTPSLFASQFGLQPLIGKSVATIPDARFHGEGVATIVDRLLSIIGQDTLTIDRKNRESITTRLPARFVLMTNELPRFNDASNALVGRFIILNLENSFYGREDINLGFKLEAELPGIFLWAVEGLKRLRARGRFEQPESGAESVRELEEMSSPVKAFVRECCEIGTTEDHYVWVQQLYDAYVRWSKAEGHQREPNKATFGKNFSSAFPAHRAKLDKETRDRFYPGIRLKISAGGSAGGGLW